MKLTTGYAYLEKRFARSVRTFTAILFVLRMLIYLSIVLTAPALALEALTGFPLWFAKPCCLMWNVNVFACVFSSSLHIIPPPPGQLSC